MTERDELLPIGILRPKGVGESKFRIRYNGLVQRLKDLGFLAVFADDHSSYDAETGKFTQQHTLIGESVSDLVQPEVMRDLTMPANDAMPLYADPRAPKLVHDPMFNAFLRYKDNLITALPEIHPATFVAQRAEVVEAAAAVCGNLVVLKPVVGMASEALFIGPKEKIPTDLNKGKYLVQEFIDTSDGVEELGIKSVHNVRVISINSDIQGAIGRINEKGGNHLFGEENDVYDQIYLPEELPESMLGLAQQVLAKLKELPGNGQNVVAIDVMRGVDPRGQQVDLVCEVNRRPIRISVFNLLKPHRNPHGIMWLAREWDKAEAAMLAGIAKGEN